MPIIEGRNSPDPGELQTCILDAYGAGSQIHGKQISQHQVGEAIESIAAELKLTYPDLAEKVIESFEQIESVCRILTTQFHRAPENQCCHVPRGKLTERAIDLIEFLGPCFPATRLYFQGMTPQDSEFAQIIDAGTSIFKRCNLTDGKQIVEVLRFVNKLLEHQDDCVLTAEQKADPQMPACGLYNRMTLDEFYQVMQSEGSQLNLAGNNDDCFGMYIYFNRGCCAEEDREFFGRALEELNKRQDQIKAHFGEEFDAHNCSSVYGAYVSSKIREDTDCDGGGIGRAQIYGALSYHTFNELRTNSRWVLGWVRTKPNPNIAENAHLRQGFYDTGIEMNFEASSDDFKLKLLLINLDQMFNPQNYNTPYVREQISPHFGLMRRSAHNTHFVNFDTRPSTSAVD